MISETHIRTLRKYLSLYEIKCYFALLERGQSAVSELAKTAGIPRASAYEALEKLRVNGLCIISPGVTS
jgi:sugar-specific transcriptional regulator TrmB